MKKYCLYLTMIAVALLFSTSCGDDENDNSQEIWMAANQSAFNAIKSNPEYKELKSPGNEGSIYYKVLNEGDGTETIYYTNTVKCFYKGWFIADHPKLSFRKDQLFDKALYDDGPPASFTVGGVVKGWTTALQNMKKGDKWEIWVPYQLGYGRAGKVDPNNGVVYIPGYSTLVFELEIIDVKGIDDK